MGCGVISGIHESTKQSENQYEINILKRSKMTNEIFIEDLDDISNQPVRSYSIHSDTIKMAATMLNAAKNNEEKSNVYVVKADYYFRYACDLQKKVNLDCFVFFRKSQTNYHIAFTLDRKNAKSMLGIAKCLLKLHQNQKALKYLEKLKLSENFSKTNEFWLLYGISIRKCAKIWNCYANSEYSQCRLSNELESAASSLNKALDLVSNSNNQIVTEKKIIENLQILQAKFKWNFNNYLDFMTKNAATYEISSTRSTSEKALYKILSIDGGGLRGILPYVILLEVEKRCHCHLKDVFDLFTGTSTGGLIAAGLVVPEKIGSSKPYNCVADGLNVCLTNAEKVFPNSFSSNLKMIFTQKYSNCNLHGAVKSLVKDYRISETLKELIIPAVNCDGLIYTEFFNTHDAKYKIDRNVLLSDVLMATCAAPTYFPPYTISGLGCFLDGGLTTHNPSKHAFETAKYRYGKNSNEIFVLSMGTGTHSSILFEENFGVKKSFWHWKTNIPSYTMVGQAHNAHNYLRSTLGDRYNRFEVFFENNIQMDDSRSVRDLLDHGTAFIEDNTDQINAVVEILLEK